MRTALQNDTFRRRRAARARAYADRQYRTVGYLDALLHASSVSPYFDSTASTLWLKGYAEGQREMAARYPPMKATVL